MKLINKFLFSCLGFLFAWQYGDSAFAFHYKAGLGAGADCSNYCKTFGEKSSADAGIALGYSYYDYDYGLFDSCHCFTTAEANLIKTCKSTPCPGTNAKGYKIAYVGSLSSSSWCGTSSKNLKNCYCSDRYYQTGTNSSGIVCSICTCGYKCVSGNKTQCSAGTYSSSGATSCTTCPSGSYCRAATCTPSKCPSNPPATSSSGAGNISSCYFPKDTELSDLTGTYLFTSNCFYS